MEGRGAAARTDEGRAFGTNLSLNISSTPKRHPKKPGKKHRCSGIKPPLVPLKRISEIDERSAQDHDDWDDDGMLNPLILMESDSPSLPNGEDGPEIDLFRSWSTAKRQVHALEERLEDEMQRAAESAKDHSAAIKILEERIARAESDRDGLRRKLARERSKASTLAADLARASRDVEKEKRRSLERAGEHSEVVARLEGDIAAAESDRDGAQLETKEVVARLEEIIAVAESERDGARSELEEGRLVLSALEADLAKAREDAEEERVMFGLHDASRVDQVRGLEKRLEEEKRRSLEAARDRSAVVAKLEETIAAAEVSRGEAVVKSKVSKDKIAELEKQNRDLLAALDASKSERDVLESRAEKANVRCNSILSDLERITAEKEQISRELVSTEATFKDAVSDLEASVKQKAEDARTLNDQVTLLTRQVSTLAQERDELAEKNESFVADLVETRQCAVKERLSFGQRDAARAEYISSLEKHLKNEKEKATENAKEQSSIIAGLERRISTAEADLAKERIASLERREKDRAEMERLKGKLDEAHGQASRIGAEQILAFEGRLKDERRKAAAIAKDHSVAVARLKQRLFAAESESEKVRRASSEREKSDRAEMQRLTGKLGEMRNEASRSGAACVDLRQDLESASRIGSERILALEGRLEDERRKAAAIAEDHSVTVARLEQRLSAAESELEKERRASSEREKSDRAEMQRLTERLGEMRNEASRSGDMCVDLRRDLESTEDLKLRLQRAHETTQCAEAERAALEERIAELVREAESRRAVAARGNIVIKSLEAERYQLIGNVQTLELEVSETESELRSTSSNLEEARSKRRQLEARIEELKGALRLAEERCESNREVFERNERALEDQIEFLKVRASSAGGWDSYLKVRAETLTSDLAEKQRSLALLTGAMERSRHEHDAAMERRAAEAAELQSSREDLREELNDVRNRLELTQSEAEASQTKLLSVMEEMSKKLDEARGDASQSRALCADLEFKLEMAETLLDENDAEMQNLREIIFKSEME